MGKNYNIVSDKRIIDLSVGELLQLLDERYITNQTGKTIFENAESKSDFLNVKQCAILTGYKEDYIRQLVSKKKIPYFKVQDHSVRFSKKEVTNWMTTKKYKPVSARVQQYIDETGFPKLI